VWLEDVPKGGEERAGHADPWLQKEKNKKKKKKRKKTSTSKGKNARKRRRIDSYDDKGREKKARSASPIISTFYRGLSHGKCKLCCRKLYKLFSRRMFYS